MSRRKEVFLTAAGILIGAALVGPAAQAAVESITATVSNQQIYVDGAPVKMEAYAINGHNYVKLRDIGKAVGFNVYWDGTVQIESDDPYTGVAPKEEEHPTVGNTVQLPTDGSQYEPRVGDVIQCDDGSTYTITDVRRWNNNMFATEKLGDLPEPTCDWDSFPQTDLPEPEVRRFQLDAGDYLFIRNLYETRRMQYTLMNLAGSNPQTSVDGKLKYGIKGTPSVTIKLTISDDLTPQFFWPWRESELTNLFNSAPQGTYSVEAWDVYLNGSFQYTEYKVHVK